MDSTRDSEIHQKWSHITKMNRILEYLIVGAKETKKYAKGHRELAFNNKDEMDKWLLS